MKDHEKANEIVQKFHPTKLTVPPNVKLGKGVRGKRSMRIEKMLSQSKPEKGREILPTPTPIHREKVVEFAMNALGSMLKTQLSEIGENTYTNWMDVSIVGVKEKIDGRTGHGYLYCIDFCVTMDYFFEGDHKEYYKVLMTDWGKVLSVGLAYTY